MAEKDPKNLKKINMQHARLRRTQALQKAVLIAQTSGHIGRDPGLNGTATYSPKTTLNLGKRMRAILIGGRDPGSMGEPSHTLNDFIASRLGNPRRPHRRMHRLH